ncbi:MAG: hypothetical protein AAF244_02690 [Pseudomonadota bacterium]
MKKLLGLGVLAAATISLSACGGLADCKDELDECGHGGAYTEERTAQADKKMVPPAPEPVVAAPAPAPVPAPAPAPAPAPEPVIDDTPVMTSAEPQFTTISK